MLKSILNRVFRDQKKTLPKINRCTINYKDAEKVGVLFDANDIKPKAINYFVKLLQNDGKDVKVLVYFEEKGESEYKFRYEYFTKQDFTKGGAPKSIQVDGFIDKDFDYLYCINPTYQQKFAYILENARAKCRVGKFFKKSIDQFDMMVRMDAEKEEDAVMLISQMIHYTKGMIINNEDSVLA